MATDDNARASTPWSVYPLVALAVFLFSVSPILVRLASDAPALSIAGMRTVFAALVVFPVALVRRRAELAGFNWRDWLLITVAGILLALHFIFWIKALYFTSVSSASVLVASSPIVLAILSYVFLKERLSRVVIFSIIGGVAGAVLLGIGDRDAEMSVSNPVLGNALALSAACFFSVYFVIGRVVRQKVSWLGYVGPLYLVVALTSACVLWIDGSPILGFDPRIYLLCLVMGLGPQIVGHGSFNYAVKYLSPTLLGLFGLMEPVGATLYAWILFSEVPSLLSFAGTGILLLSVGVALRATGRRGRQDTTA